MIPITISKIVNGSKNVLTYYVTSDYLAFGHDKEYIRSPLNFHTIKKLSENFNVIPPTKLMVDQIWMRASVKLSPKTKPPGRQMTSVQYFVDHHNTIEGQILTLSNRLIAGHKKDVVISNKLLRAPRKIAIYGWHQLNGKPIQPLSTIHFAHYADYSHGARLVSRNATLNGQTVDLKEILADAQLSQLISHEGPISLDKVLQ